MTSYKIIYESVYGLYEFSWWTEKIKMIILKKNCDFF